jgi:hypothetical protein
VEQEPQVRSLTQEKTHPSGCVFLFAGRFSQAFSP